jgi:methylenetetrahydrofolate dehydrogenase (NADP+) / methenyltetrahydrofolate cyclohydrolase
MGFQLFSLPENTSEIELLKLIETLNQDKNISGYIVQLPLPVNINSLKIIESISPQKDVDGFHPVSQGKLLVGEKDGFIPCTPL